jgi:signal transduction histidine kinase
VTLTVTSIVLAAFALALTAYAPGRRLLAAAALLASLSLALPVHAPTLLAGAVLVVADTARVGDPVALLAAAVTGLVSIAMPAHATVVAALVTFLALVAIARAALRRKLRADLVLDLLARSSFAAAVLGEVFADHRLAALARVSSLTLAGSFGFAALVARSQRAHALASQRHLRLSSRKATASPHDPSPSATAEASRAPVASSHDDLARALRRIVHELRQPVGAASNALATGNLPSTDASTATALRELAGSELQAALESLEHLARFARMSAGEPVALPAVDAVEIALGAHAENVDLDRSYPGTIAVDPAPLGYALEALVQNARDAAPNARPCVALRPGQDAGFVILEVRNAGAQLEEGALEDAAQPFFTTRAGRLGLGASLAARYAACMGGRFVLRRDGDHTVAELHLPTERAA